MPNQWDALKDTTLSALKEAVKGFTDANLAPLKDFLAEIAEDYAKEKYLAVMGPEDERAEHEENLDELLIQVKGRYKRLNYNAAAEVHARIEGALDGVGHFLKGLNLSSFGV